MIDNIYYVLTQIEKNYVVSQKDISGKTRCILESLVNDNKIGFKNGLYFKLEKQHLQE